VYTGVMVILIHVLIALASIGVASVAYFKPSMKLLVASYGLIVATVASGTYLVVAAQASILHACLSGLFYVTVVSIVTIATHVKTRRLALNSNS
jgi:hypothetical protein